ncbi:hypothetical protein HDV05_007557 [Chytridiales sp. JEL 0842]|nr:hypothetical protein HDV05_007557 [Chytridiales sp. JEL 0842]
MDQAEELHNVEVNDVVQHRQGRGLYRLDHWLVNHQGAYYQYDITSYRKPHRKHVEYGVSKTSTEKFITDAKGLSKTYLGGFDPKNISVKTLPPGELKDDTNPELTPKELSEIMKWNLQVYEARRQQPSMKLEWKKLSDHNQAIALVEELMLDSDKVVFRERKDIVLVTQVFDFVRACHASGEVDTDWVKMIEVLSILMVPINNKINSISSYAVNIDTAVALTANIK